MGEGAGRSWSGGPPASLVPRRRLPALPRLGGRERTRHDGTDERADGDRPAPSPGAPGAAPPPNPWVGCVIVARRRDRRARAPPSRPAAPHAEVAALRDGRRPGPGRHRLRHARAVRPPRQHAAVHRRADRRRRRPGRGRARGSRPAGRRARARPAARARASPSTSASAPTASRAIARAVPAPPPHRPRASRCSRPR